MLTYCPDKNTSKFSIELSLKEKVLGCHNHDEKILEFTYNISNNQTNKNVSQLSRLHSHWLKATPTNTKILAFPKPIKLLFQN